MYIYMVFTTEGWQKGSCLPYCRKRNSNPHYPNTPIHIIAQKLNNFFILDKSHQFQNKYIYIIANDIKNH